jgi:hypothetical protein
VDETADGSNEPEADAAGPVDLPVVDGAVSAPSAGTAVDGALGVSEEPAAEATDEPADTQPATEESARETAAAGSAYAYDDSVTMGTAADEAVGASDVLADAVTEPVEAGFVGQGEPMAEAIGESVGEETDEAAGSIVADTTRTPAGVATYGATAGEGPGGAAGFGVGEPEEAAPTAAVCPPAGSGAWRATTHTRAQTSRQDDQECRSTASIHLERNRG